MTESADLFSALEGGAEAPKPDQLMPPWEYDATKPRDSIWWKMGFSGDYFDDFTHWFMDLSPDRQAAYTWRHPEPSAWRGFYDALMG